uniref:DUF4283 domain-containing protein n=1 Tax=Physcomitrium patens TaxID=3218 RepID=A0A7I4EQK5_PHYPA
MVLGQILGKNPGVQKFTLWACQKLHTSFVALSMRANNYFELEFAHKEGRNLTISEQSFMLETQEIRVSSWTPYFGTDNQIDNKSTKTALWAQVIGLSHRLRTKAYLTDVLSNFSEVLLIDDNENY